MTGSTALLVLPGDPKPVKAPLWAREAAQWQHLCRCLFAGAVCCLPVVFVLLTRTSTKTEAQLCQGCAKTQQKLHRPFCSLEVPVRHRRSAKRSVGGVAGSCGTATTEPGRAQSSPCCQQRDQTPPVGLGAVEIAQTTGWVGGSDCAVSCRGKEETT